MERASRMLPFRPLEGAQVLSDEQLVGELARAAEGLCRSERQLEWVTPSAALVEAVARVAKDLRRHGLEEHALALEHAQQAELETLRRVLLHAAQTCRRDDATWATLAVQLETLEEVAGVLLDVRQTVRVARQTTQAARLGAALAQRRLGALVAERRRTP